MKIPWTNCAIQNSMLAILEPNASNYLIEREDTYQSKHFFQRRPIQGLLCYILYRKQQKVISAVRMLKES